jgi:NTP pyrophosphatase (non-canonical NTP hydrolase)
MQFDDYQRQAVGLNISGDGPKKNEILVLGLVEEAGEVAGKWKKLLAYRGGELTATDCDEIVKELGDTLWYLTVLADSLGSSLEDVAQRNLNKLQSRHEWNTIRGQGDNR